MLTLIQFKAGFFRSDELEKKAEKGNKRSLSQFGAFVRKRARGSLRRGGKKRKPSKPGKPPHVHSTSKTANLKFILFAYERARQGVVIGPVAWRAAVVPELQEKGGSARVRRRKKLPIRRASARQSESFRRLVREGRIVMPPNETTAETVTFPKRPFMVPAFEHVKNTSLPDLWRDAIR